MENEENRHRLIVDSLVWISNWGGKHSKAMITRQRMGVIRGVNDSPILRWLLFSFSSIGKVVVWVNFWDSFFILFRTILVGGNFFTSIITMQKCYQLFCCILLLLSHKAINSFRVEKKTGKRFSLLYVNISETLANCYAFSYFALLFLICIHVLIRIFTLLLLLLLFCCRFFFFPKL